MAPTSIRPLFLAAALPLAACNATSTPTSTQPGGSAATVSVPAPGASTAPPANASLSSFSTLVDLAEVLNDKGVGCKLQYEALHDEATGKKELSLCTIDGDLAELVIWDDSSSVTQFVASAKTAGDVLAYGKEWSVSMKKPAVAQKVATALGGAALTP